MIVHLCALLSVLFIGSYGERHICPLPSLPCRLAVTIRDMNNQPLSEADGEACTCNGVTSCPNDWHNTSYVIRRKLVSVDNKIILKMMFCNPIEPERICNPGEVALVVTGSLHIPTNVESYNCRCRGNRPLHLHTRRMNSGHNLEHRYVCGYDKPFCSTANNYNETCMSRNIEDEGEEYHCKCRKPRACTLDPVWPHLRATCKLSYVNNLIN